MAHWETPAGTASLRDTRFPLVFVGGPIPGQQAGDRGLARQLRGSRLPARHAPIRSSLRGVPGCVFDTLKSLGGINEIRFAAGYQLGPETSVGGAVYWITGSSRLEARRSFSDTTFIPFRQTAELSYQGVGFSLGITQRLTPALQLAATDPLRCAGVSVDRDSTHAYNVDLPYTLSAGAMLQAPRGMLTVAASGSYPDLVRREQRSAGAGRGRGAEYHRALARRRVQPEIRRPAKSPAAAGCPLRRAALSRGGGTEAQANSASRPAPGCASRRIGPVSTSALEHAWRSEGIAVQGARAHPHLRALDSTVWRAGQR